MSASKARACLLLLLGASAGDVAIAQPVSVGFHDKGNVSTTRFQDSALTSRPALNPPVLTLTQWNGLGVTDTVIDPGESVEFAFDAPATDVAYYVQFATDSNGNGLFGETFVEGYGLNGVWLNTVVISGVGSRDVSAAFGGQPLTALRLRPSERMRIYSLTFNSGTPVTVGFHDKSNVTTTAFRGSGLTVGPALDPPVLALTQWNGLGVTDTVIDPGESVEFAFDAPATDVAYYVQFATDSNGNGLFGETFVEGYGLNGVWLNTVVISGVGSRDVSAAFGGQPLTALRLRPSERMRIYSLGYTPAAMPATPQGLAGRAKINKVGLTWQPANNALIYRVFRKLSTESAFVDLGVVATTAYIDYMPSGTASANYYVVAENLLGASPPSTIITVVPTLR